MEDHYETPTMTQYWIDKDKKYWDKIKELEDEVKELQSQRDELMNDNENMELKIKNLHILIKDYILSMMQSSERSLENYEKLRRKNKISFDELMMTNDCFLTLALISPFACFFLSYHTGFGYCSLFLALQAVAGFIVMFMNNKAWKNYAISSSEYTKNITKEMKEYDTIKNGKGNKGNIFLALFEN